MEEKKGEEWKRQWWQQCLGLLLLSAQWSGMEKKIYPVFFPSLSFHFKNFVCQQPIHMVLQVHIGRVRDWYGVQ